jgi:hypothetical protein
MTTEPTRSPRGRPFKDKENLHSLALLQAAIDLCFNERTAADTLAKVKYRVRSQENLNDILEDAPSRSACLRAARIQSAAMTSGEIAMTLWSLPKTIDANCDICEEKTQINTNRLLGSQPCRSRGSFDCAVTSQGWTLRLSFRRRSEKPNILSVLCGQCSWLEPPKKSDARIVPHPESYWVCLLSSRYYSD